MGFLNGAYGKLMAGRLVRDLQYQMTGIQSRLRRVSRDIGQKEKFYQAQTRNMKLQMQDQMRTYINSGLSNLIANGDGKLDAGTLQGLQIYGSMYNGAKNGANLSNMASMLGNGGISTAASTLFAQVQQSAQMEYTQNMIMWENMQEVQKEADLEALKDLEQDLQTQKDNLESRLQIAKGEYEAKKQEEKDGAQNIKPDYTGQG